MAGAEEGIPQQHHTSELLGNSWFLGRGAPSQVGTTRLPGAGLAPPPHKRSSKVVLKAKEKLGTSKPHVDDGTGGPGPQWVRG